MRFAWHGDQKSNDYMLHKFSRQLSNHASIFRLEQKLKAKPRPGQNHEEIHVFYLSATQTYVISEFFHNCLTNLKRALFDDNADKTIIKTLVQTSYTIPTKWEDPITGVQTLSIPCQRHLFLGMETLRVQEKDPRMLCFINGSSTAGNKVDIFFIVFRDYDEIKTAVNIAFGSGVEVLHWDLPSMHGGKLPKKRMGDTTPCFRNGCPNLAYNQETGKTVSCKHCNDMKYCSKKCRKEDAKYHAMYVCVGQKDKRVETPDDPDLYTRAPKICNFCKKRGERGAAKLKKCQKCRKVYYCNSECQRNDFSSHKKICGKEINNSSNASVISEKPIVPWPKEFSQKKTFNDNNNNENVDDDSVLDNILDQTLNLSSYYDTSCHICKKKILHGPGSRDTVRMLCCGGVICYEPCSKTLVSRSRQVPTCPTCSSKIPTSEKEIMDYVQKNVDKGKAWAQIELGAYYTAGMYGLAMSKDMGFKLYLAAAKQGDPVGIYNVAGAYKNGHGVQIDHNEMVQWYMKGCEQGERGCQFKLGHLLWNGEIVEGDENLAFYWMKKSAEAGHPDAIDALGNMYEMGVGCQVNYNESAKWLRKAIEIGKLNYGENPKYLRMMENTGKVTFHTSKHCGCCGKAAGAEIRMMRCGRCQNIWYCSKQCQVENWKKHHKTVCKKR
jgi:hypothetical protein